MIHWTSLNLKTSDLWDFPGVQWLGFHAPNAEAPGSIPSGTGIPHVATKSSHAATKTWCSQIHKK